MQKIVPLILLIGLAVTGEPFSCGHDHVQTAPDIPIELRHKPWKNRRDRRYAESNEERPFKIVIDYATNPNSNGEHPHENLQRYYQHVIFPRIADHLSKIMKKVGGDSFGDTIPSFSSHSCSHITYPERYANKTTDADMLVLLEFSYGVDYAAAANVCKFDSSGIGRPYVCGIDVSASYASLEAEDANSQHYLLFHEIGHCLGFASFYYDLFPSGDPTTSVTKNMNGDSRTVLQFTSPTLLNLIRSFSGASDAEGVQLESEGFGGSVNSHFEKLHFNNEFMTAMVTGNEVVSEFFIGLMEDTGWYKTDKNYAERLYWGWNEGKDFYDNSSCNSTGADEFCNLSGSVGCDQNYLSKTRCEINYFSDNCKIKENKPRYECTNINGSKFSSTEEFEVIGANSRCFETINQGVKSAGCYISSCETDGSGNKYIKVTVDGVSGNCTTSGQTLSLSGITVTCPKIDQFCAAYGDCPNDCSGNGRCLLNGTCRCFAFFTGLDCSEKESCPYEVTEGICQVICPHSNFDKDCKFVPEPTEASNLDGLVIPELKLTEECIPGYCTECDSKESDDACRDTDTFKMICLPYVLNDDGTIFHPIPLEKPELITCVNMGCMKCHHLTDCRKTNLYVYICDPLYFFNQPFFPPKTGSSGLFARTAAGKVDKEGEGDCLSCLGNLVELADTRLYRKSLCDRYCKEFPYLHIDVFPSEIEKKRKEHEAKAKEQRQKEEQTRAAKEA